MSTRHHRVSWCVLAVISLTGCGGGPSDQELCAAIAAALPLVYVTTLSVLWFLEQIRRLPDRGAGSLVSHFVGAVGALAAISASLLLFDCLPEVGIVAVAFIVVGAVALGVSLIVWRARRRSAYASRILLAAQSGTGVGLPALILWHSSLKSVVSLYISFMLTASIGVAFYVTPLLLLGLLLESAIRRNLPAPRSEGESRA